MYVCMYVGMASCMYVCMCVCMYVCKYVGVYVCMYVCISECMYELMYVCVYVCMCGHLTTGRFQQAYVHLGAITWGEALRRPEAAARINECNESRTLCFYARLWVGFARRVADVASPQQAQSVGQSPRMQASQAQPSRSQPTRCCVVCLEEMEITMAAVPCGHCRCERCSLHVCSIMYVCMYVFKYVRRLANIGRQPQGAALQYQKELASGNEIGRRTEQRCYPEKPRSQGLSKKWHGWAIRSQERTLPHSGTHVHCQDR